jgi:DNA-binding MarR family transcriptional regulator
MASPRDIGRLLDILHATTIALILHGRRDLSARQLAIFLTCYLDEGPHTVRGLAAKLGASTSAVTQALHRLARFGLIARKPDPRDGRSVMIVRTADGTAFLQRIRIFMSKATKASAGAIHRGALLHTAVPTPHSADTAPIQRHSNSPVRH